VAAVTDDLLSVRTLGLTETKRVAEGHEFVARLDECARVCAQLRAKNLAAGELLVGSKRLLCATIGCLELSLATIRAGDHFAAHKLVVDALHGFSGARDGRVDAMLSTEFDGDISRCSSSARRPGTQGLFEELRQSARHLSNTHVDWGCERE
jgi:hypothetical protein